MKGVNSSSFLERSTHLHVVFLSQCFSLGILFELVGTPNSNATNPQDTYGAVVIKNKLLVVLLNNHSNSV